MAKAYCYRRVCPSYRPSVRKQLPCEHTQGFNYSPIAIIFGMQLVWVLMNVWIVNEPYPTREMAQLDLEKSPIATFICGDCEHTQCYNSSPIAIIFSTKLEWVLIKVWIVTEP